MSCNNYDPNNGYEDDDAEINFSVGRRFLTGNGVEKDVKRALELFKAAADAGLQNRWLRLSPKVCRMNLKTQRRRIQQRLPQ